MSLQSTVSESTLVALLAARKNKILEMKLSEPDADESSLNSRLIAYASDQVGYKLWGEWIGLCLRWTIRWLWICITVPKEKYKHE